MLAIHEQLSKLHLQKNQMNFDATCFYPSAMYYKISVCPKIENGFAFIPHAKDIYLKAFSNQTFNQDGIESAIKKKNYNPPDLFFQHIPVKEEVKKREVNGTRNG